MRWVWCDHGRPRLPVEGRHGSTLHGRRLRSGQGSELRRWRFVDFYKWTSKLSPFTPKVTSGASTMYYMSGSISECKQMIFSFFLNKHVSVSSWRLRGSSFQALYIHAIFVYCFNATWRPWPQHSHNKHETLGIHARTGRTWLLVNNHLLVKHSFSRFLV